MENSSMVNIFSTNIAKAIKVKGLKQKAIAEKTGITPAYLSEILGGKKQPSDRVIYLICQAIGVSENWARTGNGEMIEENKFRQFAAKREEEGQDKLRRLLPELRELGRIPVLGHISAGFPNIAAEEILGYISPPDAPAGGYALIVRGSSMEPYIKDGDYVIFVDNGDYHSGDVLVLLDEWGDATLKRLREKDGEKYLVPDNSTYPTMKPNENYRIVGKVVKVWRDVRF
jgi:SOS-response transcriptional repressor LexA